MVVNNLSPYVIDSAKKLAKTAAFGDLRLLVITTDPDQYKHHASESMPVEFIQCGFITDQEVASALQPFKAHIRAVVCRGDKNIQYLRQVIPHLPKEVLVATPQALEIATDKRLMREAFMRHAPEITPQFVQVHDASDATISKVESHLQYPVIVKPANLASSLLIESCTNRAELAKTLQRVFATISQTYKQQGRAISPQVIVEEFMEGDFYSVDSYVMRPGEFYHCPVVGYVPAKTMGIDDFFLYKRFLPSGLSEPEAANAQKTVEKALTAIGLTHSSAHVELVLTKNGWKIIEIGPRLGRFRHIMYREAYDIDHSLNDLLIHLGQQPVIPQTLLQLCTAYSIYPYAEGSLQEITDVDKVQQSPNTVFMRIFAKKGDRCVHAKNGGTALAEFVIAGKDEAAFKELTAFVEQRVKAVVV